MELSGIYKPFIKAFKELISNAHDADAKQITVSLSDDMSSMEVHDDGLGMTPYEFHRDFARLGGSTAWLQRGTSPGGAAQNRLQRDWIPGRRALLQRSTHRDSRGPPFQIEEDCHTTESENSPAT